MKRVWLLPALACVFTSGAAEGQVRVLRLEYVVVREGSDARGQQKKSVLTRIRFVSPSGRIRTETVDPMTSHRHVQISDDARDEWIELDLDSRTAVRRAGVRQRASAGVPMFGSFVPERGQREELGTSTMQGFQCRGFRNRVSGGHMIESWFCRDSVSGQEFLGSTYSRTPDGRGTWREELKTVARDFAVDPALFEIPPDFRIADR